MTTSGGMAPRAGLQPERTALSWQRTAISADVAVVPLLLVDARQGHWGMAALSAVGALVITALVLLLRQRVAHLSAARRRPTGPARRPDVTDRGAGADRDSGSDCDSGSDRDSGSGRDSGSDRDSGSPCADIVRVGAATVVVALLGVGTAVAVMAGG